MCLGLQELDYRQFFQLDFLAEVLDVEYIFFTDMNFPVQLRVARCSHGPFQFPRSLSSVISHTSVVLSSSTPGVPSFLAIPFLCTKPSSSSGSHSTTCLIIIGVVEIFRIGNEVIKLRWKRRSSRVVEIVFSGKSIKCIDAMWNTYWHSTSTVVIAFDGWIEGPYGPYCPFENNFFKRIQTECAYFILWNADFCSTGIVNSILLLVLAIKYCTSNSE